MAAHEAPPSLGFSRIEHWSGLPFPSPRHESENEVTQSCPTLSDPMDYRLPGSSVHGISQAKSTGVECHCLLCTFLPSLDQIDYLVDGMNSLPLEKVQCFPPLKELQFFTLTLSLVSRYKIVLMSFLTFPLNCLNHLSLWSKVEPGCPQHTGQVV